MRRPSRVIPASELIISGRHQKQDVVICIVCLNPESLHGPPDRILQRMSQHSVTPQKKALRVPFPEFYKKAESRLITASGFQLSKSQSANAPLCLLRSPRRTPQT